ncbi:MULTISPECIES: 4-hydroxy-tetrahydrodipicolinate synthase [Streptomyces]|uniref:4-hydroxy-tetrahydrodipicolinate synthase n=1 Tax=Streptomyces edwardsiae TaxID=3075527 RepID=A0ABU2QGG6_9ACTN|nr:MULTISPECIES: 4-hydroxy-tetrahydrodipicolinate synthase [unclassified Streptomyces]MDT0403562.1 4-hydroxy-tetrahydrodipicolinate synthase [Streptomyces sp. DSM 41635]
MTPPPSAPLGRTLCAMITPFTPTGALDLDGAQRLADHLVTEGCDGLVLSGTTGESPTTTDAEKSSLVRAVREAIGTRATIVAGIGTPDTAHTTHLAREAEKAGADALLAVAPYYSRPPQDAIEAHFLTVADATALPLVLYDIPSRTGVRIEPATILRLADHPRVTAVKDCSYDFLAAQKLMSRTDLAYYAGCDEHNLALYSVGAAGCVSTVANVAPAHIRAVLDAYDAGDTRRATHLQHRLTPLIEAMMAKGLPGTVTAKALLPTLGLPAGPVRPPLQPADRATTAGLEAEYRNLTAARPRTEGPRHVGT